jgi:predicted transcriptional regulator
MSCLAALWKLGHGTVHDVAAALQPAQPLAYTTVMTLLERLVRRGHLSRQKSGRSFTYSPATNPDQLRSAALDDLTRLYFHGSRDALLAFLDAAPSPQPEPAPEPSPIDTTLL